MFFQKKAVFLTIEISLQRKKLPSMFFANFCYKLVQLRTALVKVDVAQNSACSRASPLRFAVIVLLSASQRILLEEPL